ncbi:chaperone of endosialidase family protein [Enterobacteriaceae bacterium ATCC 29904]|nr:chaperone of endosialidase family protein [Enterobacteriaceae bacterium ATCC 29904]
MSAGTLTLTSNSDAATGTGTNFSTELSAGDFAVVVVGGITYTLPVKSVDSATKLTLVSKYPGPSQNGLAWNAVPRLTQNLITAAVVAQATEALRGLNYDKQNWQQVFSGTGTVTVKLPDGTTYTGPAWNSITSSVLLKASNLSDLADKAAAWLNIRPSGSTPLAADPVSALDATTKRWVETLLTSAPALAASGPISTSTGFSISGTSTPFVAMFPAGANSNAIGGRTRLETTIDSFSSAVSVINFSRRRSDGISSGAIDVQIPQSSGTLALQGTSDINYKKNVKPYDGQQSVENIKAMDLVTFVFRDDEKERLRRGVIAQQIEEIDPSYVKHTFEPEGEEVYDKEGNFCGYEGKRERVVLDTNVMLLDTICALKVALTRIDALENEISLLKN